MCIVYIPIPWYVRFVGRRRNSVQRVGLSAVMVRGRMLYTAKPHLRTHRRGVAERNGGKYRTHEIPLLHKPATQEFITISPVHISLLSHSTAVAIRWIRIPPALVRKRYTVRDPETHAAVRKDKNKRTATLPLPYHYHPAAGATAICKNLCNLSSGSLLASSSSCGGGRFPNHCSTVIIYPPFRRLVPTCYYFLRV